MGKKRLASVYYELSSFVPLNIEYFNCQINCRYCAGLLAYSFMYSWLGQHD